MSDKPKSISTAIGNNFIFLRKRTENLNFCPFYLRILLLLKTSLTDIYEIIFKVNHIIYIALNNHRQKHCHYDNNKH